MKSKLISSIIVVLVSVLALPALAQLTIPTRTQSQLAQLARDPSVIQDQSQIPGQDVRKGFAVAIWDYERDGASGTVNIGPVIPAGVAVVGGYALVIDTVSTGAATNTAFTLQTAEDLKIAATSIAAKGLVTLRPSADSSPNKILVTEDSRISVVLGTTATSGTVLVYLDLVYLGSAVPDPVTDD